SDVCTTRLCPDAVTLGIDRGQVFADADDSVLHTDIVRQHKYSSLSDSSKSFQSVIDRSRSTDTQRSRDVSRFIKSEIAAVIFDLCTVFELY
ncbi:hypothetical protein PENTCL1PPCAC_18505, partial [Pristionchus entomophagus]